MGNDGRRNIDQNLFLADVSIENTHPHVETGRPIHTRWHRRDSAFAGGGASSAQGMDLGRVELQRRKKEAGAMRLEARARTRRQKASTENKHSQRCRTPKKSKT